MGVPLPSDIFYEISLYLPHTRDILSLALTSCSVRAALSTSALFKSRLSLQGWDVSAWQDEDDHDSDQLSGDWKRWMRIDYTYNRTLQLLEEAAVDNYFFRLTESPIISDTTWVASPNRRVHANPQNTTPGSPPALDEEKTGIWLRKLSEVLPKFVAHRSTRNVLQITETKYHDALRAYLKVAVDLGCAVQFPGNFPSSKVAPSEYGWFERACFSLIALLMQCNTSTVMTIFGMTRTALDSPMCPLGSFWRLKHHAMAWFTTSQPPRSEYFPLQNISGRYFACFLIQTTMYLELHLDAAAETGVQLSLLAPSLPHIDPASLYNDLFEVGPATTSSQPWLRNGLAGTPLAGLSPTASRPWAGYYTSLRTTVREPPMFFELRSFDPTPDAEPNCVYFHGEGQDGVGPFTLQGLCDTRTGAVRAIKAYIGEHQWGWSGVITPFGMVGRWGIGWGDSGWWWVWPREWSPAVADKRSPVE
ncbi:hypothetical protein BJV78DRAFT_1364611 [Lactifluus subvellereus]|nr:hypothetical protein BJV78DRAFT_1364611 [Lactifluus subvellereus]